MLAWRGYGYDDQLIADLMAEKVQELYPAKEPDWEDMKNFKK
jgi:hypothetical protein